MRRLIRDCGYESCERFLSTPSTDASPKLLSVSANYSLFTPHFSTVSHAAKPLRDPQLLNINNITPRRQIAPNDQSFVNGATLSTHETHSKSDTPRSHIIIELFTPPKSTIIRHHQKSPRFDLKMRRLIRDCGYESRERFLLIPSTDASLKLLSVSANYSLSPPPPQTLLTQPKPRCTTLR